ncbi:hypothetical protein C7S10_07170 [Nocardioides currus]|uniref:Uncharacterized protein n=1 Tax=Nocardioides currus TaxID=2133958 RepID=A0A2R7YZM6_9ACTN|nr:hypothetical protein C7S10_07170 [Nocardioides currus]
MRATPTAIRSGVLVHVRRVSTVASSPTRDTASVDSSCARESAHAAYQPRAVSNAACARLASADISTNSTAVARSSVTLVLVVRAFLPLPERDFFTTSAVPVNERTMAPAPFGSAKRVCWQGMTSPSPSRLSEVSSSLHARPRP